MKTLPNSLGGKNKRLIHTKERELHPSFIGYLDIADTSSSDPGQSTSLSPYCNMTSMYFDDSLYDNEGHFKMKQYRDEDPRTQDDIYIDADNAEDYNTHLDDLVTYGGDKFQFYGVSNKPHELVIEEDPRNHYKQFDEKYLEGDDSGGEEDKK